MRLRPRSEYAVAEPQSAVFASGLLGRSRGLPLEKNAGLTGATETTDVGNAMFLQCALCENHTVRICIVNRGFVQIRTSRVLREVAVPPFSTCETHSPIAKAVVDTTVPADLRRPVTRQERHNDHHPAIPNRRASTWRLCRVEEIAISRR